MFSILLLSLRYVYRRSSLALSVCVRQLYFFDVSCCFCLFDVPVSDLFFPSVFSCLSFQSVFELFKLSQHINTLTELQRLLRPLFLKYILNFSFIISLFTFFSLWLAVFATASWQFSFFLPFSLSLCLFSFLTLNFNSFLPSLSIFLFYHLFLFFISTHV